MNAIGRGLNAIADRTYPIAGGMNGVRGHMQTDLASYEWHPWIGFIRSEVT